MLKIKLTLVLIIILAFLLRFYDLGKNPPGINLDEAAIGYNAYSILKTGQDEYGQFLPIVFRSHDDYKPPLYIYLTVPSVAIFGLNEFAVRFPSAVMGIMAVAALYILTRNLFPRSTRIPLMASFLLSISPWHLQFTRVAYETGSTILFTTLGLFFFRKGLKEAKGNWWLLSGIFFGLELHLYQASKVFVPLFVIFLLALNFKKVLSQKRNSLIFVLGFAVFMIPVIFLSTSVAGQMRFNGTSIFQNSESQTQNFVRRQIDREQGSRLSGLIFHPLAMAYSEEILSGYLSHFRPDFLFVGSHGPPTNYVAGVGLLYLWELPLILLGAYFLWQKHKAVALVISVWLALSPIPASVTSGVPSAIRTTLILPTFQIFGAAGLWYFVSILQKKSRFILALFRTLFILLVVYFLAYYLHMMLIHAPLDYSQSWYYSYKDVVTETAQLAKNYDRVIVSTSLHQPQNFFAFFLHYDPQTYLKVDGGTISGGFRESRNHFANYYFSPIEWDKMSKYSSTLFVGFPNEFPSDVTVLKKFHYLNGQTSVIIVEKNEKN